MTLLGLRSDHQAQHTFNPVVGANLTKQVQCITSVHTKLFLSPTGQQQTCDASTETEQPATTAIVSAMNVGGMDVAVSAPPGSICAKQSQSAGSLLTPAASALMFVQQQQHHTQQLVQQQQQHTQQLLQQQAQQSLQLFTLLFSK